jgi:hypothetical protein
MALPPSSSPCAASFPPCVITSQYNNARTDVNALETVFTTSNVNTGGFGAHTAQFTVSASGIPSGFTNNPVYAQPLYVSNITIGGVVHNVVYIAALNGEIYAYDADNLTTPTKLWSRDETGGTGMKGLKHNCDVSATGGASVTGPEPFLDFAGVISTPVIEISTMAGATALYVVNLCQTPPPVSAHWYLTAVSLVTGATLGMAEIAYSGTQVSTNPYGPQQAFAASHQLQRPSLLITAGQVGGTGPVYRSLIAGFGTSTNETSVGYQGWLFAYDTTNSANVVPQALSLPYITECYYPPDPGNTPPCTTQLNPSNPSAQIANPCGNGGGVWMSNRGAAANSTNQVFSAAGNGGFNYCPSCTHHCAGPPPGTPNIQDFTNFGEAVLRVSLQNVWTTASGQAPFWPDEYFVPYDIPSGVNNPNGYTSYFQLLNDNDWDLGVSGMLLFDDNYLDSSGDVVAGTSMSITSSKRGDGYVMLQSGLGQYNNPDMVVAEFGVAASNPNCLNSHLALSSCDETRTLAYWLPSGATGGGFLLAWPWHETLESFQWAQPLPLSQYTFQGASTASNPFSGLGTGIKTGYTGGNLSVTVNPGESPAAAVVWAAAFPYGTSNPYGSACARLDGRNCPGVLLAYSLETTPTAGALASIWPATLPTSPLFEPSPYAIPTAVNGKVYAPAYGLADGAGGYTVSGVQVYGF